MTSILTDHYSREKREELCQMAISRTIKLEKYFSREISQMGEFANLLTNFPHSR